MTAAPRPRARQPNCVVTETLQHFAAVCGQLALLLARLPLPSTPHSLERDLFNLRSNRLLAVIATVLDSLGVGFRDAMRGMAALCFACGRWFTIERQTPGMFDGAVRMYGAFSFSPEFEPPSGFTLGGK
jgi:hypothetical protein